MKDIFSQFREQAGMIRVSPHDRAWKRISVKLEAHRNHKRSVTSRWLAIAAVALCLIAVSASLFYYAQIQTMEKGYYSSSIEDLAVRMDQAESIFDTGRIRQSYADLRMPR